MCYLRKFIAGAFLEKNADLVLLFIVSRSRKKHVVVSNEILSVVANHVTE